MNIEHSFLADLPELGQVEKDIADTEDHLQVGAFIEFHCDGFQFITEITETESCLFALLQL